MMLMAACAVLPRGANAQDSYPSKPIRIIVPYSAGTPPDVVTRIIANKLTASMGQSVIVDNRPGATGTVGLQELLRQPADGYTIMTMLQPVTVAPALYANFPYDFGGTWRQ
jgi:tripartite-type tricarboxylate transporter receptor subunit TctC